MSAVSLLWVAEYVVDIPGGVARWWLDDREGAGRVVLLAGGDVWSYSWPAANRGGASLFDWVADPDCIPYLSRKMRAREYDSDATERNAREIVCELRRQDAISRGQARDLYDAAGTLADERAADDWLGALGRVVEDPYDYTVTVENTVLAFRHAVEALAALRGGA